jgi:ABC-type branched-subunit amino acid transport system substrate-binding protein
LEEEVQPKQSRFATLALGAAALLWVILWVVSCNQQIPSSLVTPTPVNTTIPVTVEVTRVVERLVVATPETPAACARGQLANTNEIVIGALVPLSRPGAVLVGFAMQTAFTLAVDDINAAGGIAGKLVRLVTYDTANSAERGALYAQRLITLDCAAVLVGGYHNPVALAVKEIAHQYGIPVIFTSASADELTQGQYPEVFRIAPSVTMLAQMPGKWLNAVGDFNQDGENFVTVIAADATENLAMLEEVEQWLSSYGVRFEAISVGLPSSDFSSVIARIVAFERVPDAIFIGLTGDAAFDLQQQMLNAHIGPEQNTLIITNASALNDQLFWTRVPGGVYTVVS